MTTCRLATPADADTFARWAAFNNDIPDNAVEAVINGVTLVLVAEVDGEPELYIPFIFSEEKPQLTIGYLGFRVGQDYRTKAKALKEMLAATKRLQEHFDCEIRVITKAEYPMGKWALKHGFTEKPDGFYLEKQ